MQSVTKRSVLSIISNIFDILGLLSPVIIRGKILMQEIWIRRLDWDETLPPDLHNIWLQTKADLNFINKIEVPHYVQTTSNSDCEFHGFADASTRAYGYCIYVRSKINHTYKTTLFMRNLK